MEQEIIMNILYKKYNIMKVLYKNRLYYTNISYENINKAMKDGFIVGNIANVNVISDRCPQFIKNRLNIESDDIESIKERIMKNNARLQTDHLYVEIIEK